MGFNFGKFLEHELVMKNIKGVELARVLDKSPAYITKMQKQNIIPDYDDLKKIADKLGISYEFLLFQIGVIEDSTLQHINFFTNIKSYLAETINNNNFTLEKGKRLMEYIIEHNEVLEMAITEEEVIKLKNFLGDEFIFPKFQNPYTEDSYSGFKKQKDINIRTGENEKHLRNYRKVPVFEDFNEDGTEIQIDKIGFDLDMKKEEINFNGNIVWYKPKNQYTYYYLVEKDFIKNGNKILFKKTTEMYIGFYTSNNSTVIISNIQNAVTKESVDTPIIYTDVNIPEDIRIIGKIISEYRVM